MGKRPYAVILSVILVTCLRTIFLTQGDGIAGEIGKRIEYSTQDRSRISGGETLYLNFSSYLGGSDFEHARDVFVDNQGYIYLVGGTKSVDFPITIGPGFNNNLCGSLGNAGRMDVFISKFNPSGALVWSRYVGGPCYDRAYGVEVDNQGNIYIAGRAGEGFPVTAGAFQTSFQGSDNGPYGLQNAFVAKISSDGLNILWASYVGVGHGARDLAIDSSGDVYLPLGYTGQGNTPPDAWFVNAYQPTPNGGEECGAIKVSGDGTQVLWASWLGGSNDDSQVASIRVDDNEYVYLTFNTNSSDLGTTSGAFDNTYNGGMDRFVAKLSGDGSALLLGTYLGGSGDEGLNTHTLALDNEGNIYIPTWTSSTDYPTTLGVFQTYFAGGPIDIAITKLSPTGGLLLSTYIGGSNGDNPDGVYVDNSGNTFITGASDSLNFPVTEDAYQKIKGAGLDVVLVRLSSDFSQLNYSTFMGGVSDDEGRSGFLGTDGSLYVVGQTNGSGWPTLNAYRDEYAGGLMDAIIAKFESPMNSPTPTPISTLNSTPTNTPSPTSTPTPTKTPPNKSTTTPTSFVPMVEQFIPLIILHK